MRCCWHQFVFPEILSPFDVNEYQLFRCSDGSCDSSNTFTHQCYPSSGRASDIWALCWSLFLFECCSVLTNFVTCWLDCAFCILRVTGLVFHDSVMWEQREVWLLSHGKGLIALLVSHWGFLVKIFRSWECVATSASCSHKNTWSLWGKRVKPSNTNTCQSIYFT